jgi:hypothetical protein
MNENSIFAWRKEKEIQEEKSKSIPLVFPNSKTLEKFSKLQNDKQKNLKLFI